MMSPAWARTNPNNFILKICKIEKSSKIQITLKILIFLSVCTSLYWNRWTNHVIDPQINGKSGLNFQAYLEAQLLGLNFRNKESQHAT